jgi:hypothetical protein
MAPVFFEPYLVEVLRAGKSSRQRRFGNQAMKKAFSGGLLGLLIGAIVMLFFSWVYGIFYLRLDPPRIEGFEFTPQVAVMLSQCLLTGVIAGGTAYHTGR